MSELPPAEPDLAPESAEAAPPAEPDYTLELALDPTAAAQLPRHPALLALRLGRARSNAEELIWLDGTAGLLAKAGQALEQPRRGPRRRLRTLPGEAMAWCPGTPPEPVPRGAEDPAEGVPVVPIAAFTGRRTVFALQAEGGPMQATLLVGKLRAVTDERAVARLVLSGPAAPVLALAIALAEDLPLLPPIAALAEEGRALARGEATRPRRRGPPLLAGAATVEAACAAALGHLLEVMLFEAPLCRLETGPEGVHQMRVALRRLRSVLRAFRPAIRCDAVDNFDAGLRDLAKLLGEARDWDVFLGGLGADAGAALSGDRRMASLLKAAEARRLAGYRALRAELEGPGFRRMILAGLQLLVTGGWRPVAEATAEPEAERAATLALAPAEYGAGLLERRWSRLCSEGEEVVTLSPEALHELRLTAKRLRYAAELFGPLWPGKATRRFLRRLAALQDLLGTANDTAVARALVNSLAPAVPAWAIGAVEGFAVAQIGDARRAAIEAWEELMLARPFWHTTSS